VGEAHGQKQGLARTQKQKQGEDTEQRLQESQHGQQTEREGGQQGQAQQRKLAQQEHEGKTQPHKQNMDHQDNLRRILVPVSNSNLNEGFHCSQREESQDAESGGRSQSNRSRDEQEKKLNEKKEECSRGEVEEQLSLNALQKAWKNFLRFLQDLTKADEDIPLNAEGYRRGRPVDESIPGTNILPMYCPHAVFRNDVLHELSCSDDLMKELLFEQEKAEEKETKESVDDVVDVRPSQVLLDRMVTQLIAEEDKTQDPTVVEDALSKAMEINPILSGAPLRKLEEKAKEETEPKQDQAKSAAFAKYLPSPSFENKHSKETLPRRPGVALAEDIMAEEEAAFSPCTDRVHTKLTEMSHGGIGSDWWAKLQSLCINDRLLARSFIDSIPLADQLHERWQMAWAAFTKIWATLSQYFAYVEPLLSDCHKSTASPFWELPRLVEDEARWIRFVEALTRWVKCLREAGEHQLNATWNEEVDGTDREPNRIADRILKRAAVETAEKEEKKCTVFPTDFASIHRGDDLQLLLPCERVLLTQPDLESLFLSRFAQRNLLSFQLEHGIYGYKHFTDFFVDRIPD